MSRRSSWVLVLRTTRYVTLFLGLGIRMLTMSQSAVEQAKDEQISDYIRKGYKSTTGSDIPIKDKETRLG